MIGDACVAKQGDRYNCCGPSLKLFAPRRVNARLQPARKANYHKRTFTLLRPQSIAAPNSSSSFSIRTHVMRAEAKLNADAIKESLGLLRRYL